MMKMKTKTTGLPPANRSSGGGGGGEWEMRPGGMLVQKRTVSDQTSPPPPTIRVRVKYGLAYHELNISSQATFGKLKKMLSGPTGLHHEDQKLMYKDKERDSKQFLDTAGVKDRSKIVLVEDPISIEKRYVEMKKTAKMEKASKSISDISLDVDMLAGQVSALESVICEGGTVEEKNVLNLVEMLMNQLIKLDEIIADGDVKLQRKMQVRRVQKYVETLDMLKAKTSTPLRNGNQIPEHKSPFQQDQQKYSNGKISSTHQPQQNYLDGQIHSENHQQKYVNGQILISSPNQQQKYQNGQIHSPNQIHKYSNGQNLSPNKQHPPRYSNGQISSPNHQQQERKHQEQSRHSTSCSVVITTQWETFDSVPPPSTSNGNSAHPKLNWDLV